MFRQIFGLNTDGFRFFSNYNPASTPRQLRCPVLAANPDAAVDQLPNLSHLFQTAEQVAPPAH